MDATAHIDDLGSFITASPSSYHAAAEVARRLTAAGWTTLDETADWREVVHPGSRLVLVRDGAVLAFAVPDRVGPATPFRILGAHTDSPTFKLKPRPALASNGWLQVAVEVYGGPIIASWFDRELALAGRLVTRDGTVHLVNTGPFARIPHLAIHLDREVNSSFAPDRQRDVQPVFAVDGPDVLAHLAGLAGVPVAEVAGHDVVAVDSAAPARFGADRALFAAGRLDNLSSVHAGLTALLDASAGHEGVAKAAGVRDGAGRPAIAVLAAFDHEELGSESRSGASGPLLADVLDRVAAALGIDLARSLPGSWCLSADAGHAVHPNRPEKHDPTHRPVLGGGPLLKINANQRYTTDAIGSALWVRICAAAGVPWQPFVSNNAVPCGSTIGPLTATRIGIPTLDVGTPLLSMHSARELCHVDDPASLAAAAAVFFTGA
ncbi:M18 family aminopeptidase [Actinoplanes sp. KI2]|uniref:M18 family aminopeptidase n=1 Tax=Actinoplanes sp. KI2 TaxID=2983315 RepID=UPI0021D611BD|nr:M18 family aminopeptidase [Actinoplanes sp. KI2]MCU7729956.1 M18 family aminopeptidase [Actinoplanes sp. KI2]